jgi:putative PIN family toxin of toxin-antitoxin system
MTRKCRIIIDTNLWISFLLSKKFDFIDKLLNEGKVQLVFCSELFTELTEVASRPKLKKFFTEKDWEFIFNIIEEYAVFISVVSSVVGCRDEKDNFLLSLAKDSKANYLLTGDKDLLILKTFEMTKIITVAEYQKNSDVIPRT